VKVRNALLIICLLMPGALWAQQVDVRLFTSHEVKAMDIVPTAGDLHWRACPECPEITGKKLSVSPAESQLRFGQAGKSKVLYVSGNYRLRPMEGPEFSADFPLRVQNREGGLLVTISMPVEAYVRAVLAAESGDFQQSESMKAMAVAVRTYAARFRGQHMEEGFDFCDTTHCQALRWNAVSPSINAAVDATKDEILWFGDTPAATYYHQSCGGAVAAGTEVWPDVDAPYLKAHADLYCQAGGGLRWESAISIADLDRALRAASIEPPLGWTTLEIASRTTSGRAQRLKLLGGKPPTSIVSASSLRFAVDRALGWKTIRSNLYEIRSAGGRIVFSGRGSGHGVGLCQAGAEEMAREGKSYREILSFYYSGTELRPAQSLEWQKRASERFDLVSADVRPDSFILPVAERLLNDGEESLGWRLPYRVEIRIFPTMDLYRNTTGEPGWVAASTRGRTIRLQPIKKFPARGILESTLRHELYHLLIESQVKVSSPVWFREGLVLALTESKLPDTTAPAMTEKEVEAILQESKDRAEMEKAYASARSRVLFLIGQYGKPTVLGWLQMGVPSDLPGVSLPAAHSPQQ
jgi:stage II sporulation protein D